MRNAQQKRVGVRRRRGRCFPAPPTLAFPNLSSLRAVSSTLPRSTCDAVHIAPHTPLSSPMRRGPSPLFPSPSTFAFLLKTFQQALAPARVPHLVGGAAPTPTPITFACTVVPRRARSLADAVDAAAARVLSRLNGGVTLAVLTVSPAYGSGAEAAAGVLVSALGSGVVIGGVADGPGVTLWAARMHGMTATPFVSYGEGALPSLEGDTWKKVAGGGDETTGALILGRTPAVGTLAARLTIALPPSATIIGGVLGGASPTTPLFMNDGVAPADAAAVGVLLRGSGVRLVGWKDDEAGEATSLPSSSTIILGGARTDATARVAARAAAGPNASSSPPPCTTIDCDAVTVDGVDVGAGCLVFRGG